jgi:predicted CXXCH cytochrome family protein
MITCLIDHVTRNQKGLLASHEIRISGELIELGRGAACQIHLPDHRVSLLHATLQRNDDGTLRIEAAQNELITINGSLERNVVPSDGMRIEIGPFLLTVKPANGIADINLSVELLSPLTGSLDVPTVGPVTLAELGISKRRFGWGLAILILIGLVVLPLMTRVSPLFEEWQAQFPISLTGWLNPAPLAPGHNVFGMKCSACHQHVFQAVADTACTQCHARMAAHQTANGPHAEKFDAIRCADCHAAHQSKAEVNKNGSATCLACHQGIGTTVAKVTDFGVAHPAFHLSIPDGKQVIRVEQEAPAMPPEKSGLKFSHQLHLVKQGVKSPTGNTVLSCRDCHALEASGEYFAPMDMQQSCQQSQCHKLRLTEPAKGVIPHGPERDAMNKLRNFYLKSLADNPSEHSKQCGVATKEGGIVKRTLTCADMLALKHAADTLFKITGKKLDCALCHDIVATDDTEAPWKVTPILLRHDWQPNAIFNHKKHATLDCTHCHDKLNSKLSEDISFPRIEMCRECHAGSVASSGKVAENCENCHRFHRVDAKHL